MKHVRRWRLGAALAVVSVVALTGAIGASAGPPTSGAAQHVCESSGGTFVEFPVEAAYGCTGGTAISLHEEFRGQQVCEHAYGGTFVVRPTGYLCQNLT